MTAAPHLIERAAWMADSVRELAWLQSHLGIGRDDLVLDIGSGANPNPRANVLCDKFVTDATERNGRPVRSDDRPFIVADVTRLPFADHAFDFVICSHLLEHVDDPGAAIGELQRVAPRGYIETPSAEWEKLYGFPFHRWMVSSDDGVLVFEEKSEAICNPDLRAWFTKAQQAAGLERRIWFARRQVGMFTSLRWDREVPFRVKRSDRRGDDGFQAAGLHGNGHELPADAGGLAAGAIDRYSRWIRRHSDRGADHLETLLRCPACAGEMRHRPAGAIGCLSCRRWYPVDGQGRIRLLVEEAAPDTAPEPTVVGSV